MTEQKKEYKLPKAGQHVAILNRYIKAGKHLVEGYQGADDYLADQLILNWELTDDSIEEGMPFWIRPFGVGAINDYDTEKSKKTQYFSQMFDDYDPEAKNAASYLGRACIVLVKHNPGKGKHAGKTFANFNGVAMYPDFAPPLDYTPSQPVLFFDYYNPTKESWEQLKPFEQEFIKRAHDYPTSKLAALLNDTQEDNSDDPDF